APGINNGIVCAPHRSDHVGMRRREGRGCHAFDDTVEWKLQFVRLVKSDFEHACNDLGAAGKALRWRIEDGQTLRRNAAGLKYFVNDLRRRRARAFHYESSVSCRISILDRLE